MHRVGRAKAEGCVSERNRAGWIPKAEAVERLGISEKQIERHCHEGMPHKKDGRHVLIKWPDARLWRDKLLIAQGEAKAKPTNRSDSIDRQAAANAELAEIELAKARNELMTVTDFDRLVGDAFARVRARLTNLPPRIAGVVLGATSIHDAQARIEPLVREAMEELRGADDVPGESEEDAAA